jgi:ADP-ribosylglycohydrolase
MASPSKSPTSKALEGKGQASKAKVPRPEVSPEEDEDEDLDDLADTDSEAEESPARTSATKSGKLKKKKKKKSSGNATFYVLLALGIFFGIAVLGALGIAIWYLLPSSGPEAVVREQISILDAYAAALEKANDPSQRAQAIKEIDAAAERLSRLREKKQKIESQNGGIFVTLEEAIELAKKYEGQIRRVQQRLIMAIQVLQRNPDAVQDKELQAAIERFASSALNYNPEWAMYRQLQGQAWLQAVVPSRPAP